MEGVGTAPCPLSVATAPNQRQTAICTCALAVCLDLLNDIPTHQVDFDYILAVFFAGVALVSGLTWKLSGTEEGGAPTRQNWPWGNDRC